MRRVHEIMHTTARVDSVAWGKLGREARLHIAFIQHGTADTGYIYENICPYCAQTLEKVTAHPEADMETVANRLLMGVVRHFRFCVHRGTGRLLVEKTDEPLGTERIIKEH